MTDKELRKLKRVALIELLIDQMEENERLRAQVTGLERQLQRQEYVLASAGFPSAVSPPREEAAPDREEEKRTENRVENRVEEIWQALDRAQPSEGSRAPKAEPPREHRKPLFRLDSLRGKREVSSFQARQRSELSEIASLLTVPPKTAAPPPEVSGQAEERDELSEALSRMILHNQ